jgi:hypothetical protein
MTMLRKALGSAAIAAMLATSATPALARPGYGWGHGGWGSYGRHYRHHDGDGFGNFLLGAIVAGGIVAVASSAARNKQDRNNGVVYGGNDTPSPRDRRNWNDAENDAANVCADGAETLASRRGIDARVDDIDYVDRDGESYRVEGRLEGGRGFSCGVRNSELTYIQFEDRVALR